MGNCCKSNDRASVSNQREQINVLQLVVDPPQIVNPPTIVNPPQIVDPYHTSELITNSFTDLNKFTFKGMLTKAKVVDVYDGDTVTIVFYFHNLPVKDSFRMYGYDSPELKPLKTTPHRELHINAGKVAREYIKRRLLEKIVWVKFLQEEKYGRLMGSLYTISPHSPDQFLGNEEEINQTMITKGYGKPYKGGTKSEFTEQELTQICVTF
jgi:endonuclease YncB( thermonuclease family)